MFSKVKAPFGGFGSRDGPQDARKSEEEGASLTTVLPTEEDRCALTLLVADCTETMRQNIVDTFDASQTGQQYGDITNMEPVTDDQAQCVKLKPRVSVKHQARHVRPRHGGSRASSVVHATFPRLRRLKKVVLFSTSANDLNLFVSCIFVQSWNCNRLSPSNKGRTTSSRRSSRYIGNCSGYSINNRLYADEMMLTWLRMSKVMSTQKVSGANCSY